MADDCRTPPIARNLKWLLATGDCIMPKEGIFAKVVQGGEAKADDPIVLKN